MINAITEERLYFTKGMTTGDVTSYKMFPDNTKVLCQLIDHDGNKIKANGTLGEEDVWCKVCDQRIFYSDILYWVIPLSKIIDNCGRLTYDITNDGASTRASLIKEPLSKMVPE
jgi:hypothetical protein